MNLKEVRMNGPDEPAGKSYGELPGIAGVPYYRSLEPRLSFILKHLPIGMHVLDLGCNAGHYCFALANKGYSCIGVDTDVNAISAAMTIQDNDKKAFVLIAFVHGDVIEFVPNKKCILYLSTFQWTAFRHGLNKAITHLSALAQEGNIMIFETSGSDSKAMLPQADNPDWIRNLLKDCGWNIIDEMKNKAETGGERWVFACTSLKK